MEKHELLNSYKTYYTRFIDIYYVFMKKGVYLMREKILVDFLKKSITPLKIDELVRVLKCSERTIRNEIKYLNFLKEKNGFSIKLIRNRGYILEVTDENLMNDYLSNIDKATSILSSNQRIDALLFYLLQSDKYTKIVEMQNLVNVSRSTITSDLQRVEEILREFDLVLERRPHYGLRVTGNESNYRKLFSKYVINSEMFVKPVMDYKKIIDQISTNKLGTYLEELLLNNNISFSDKVLENLIIHLKLTIFRVSSHNLIKVNSMAENHIDDKFYGIASDLAKWLKNELNIVLPNEEIFYLAVHISAKTSELILDKDKQEQLIIDLIEMLAVIDDEFLTSFSNANSHWIEGLIMHLSPLLNRLYFNIHLENPLIDELSLKYTNVVVVAFRFGELFKNRYGFSLTKDEIGFIAIHLAAFLEEERQKAINNVKRLIVICATGGGSANLIRLKLEKYFPQASVITISNSRLAYLEESPDLFFSTIPIGPQINGVPVIEIKDFLNDKELIKIIDQAPLEISQNDVNKRILSLKSLFDPRFFQVLSDGDYLEIIRSQAKKMIMKNVAEEDFLDLVLEREFASSTVYGKGIAGPHPIRLDAKQDSIGITILENPIFLEGKEIRFIMLINLKRGHLFIHKEISRLIMNLMSNDKNRKLIFECKTFNNFIEIIENMI